MTLSASAYLSIQVHASFIRHVSQLVLKDTKEIDFLVDHWLNTAFSRFQGANDISSANDSLELQTIIRTMQDTFQQLSDQSLLLGKWK
jgi:hypothetical protein